MFSRFSKFRSIRSPSQLNVKFTYRCRYLSTPIEKNTDDLGHEVKSNQQNNNSSNTPDVQPEKNIYENVDIETVLSIAGCEISDPQTGAVSPPIHFSSTFERDENLEFSRGYNYGRLGNPTRNLFEKTLAEIECGSEGFAFSSGMQAATSIIMCYPKAHVLLPDDLYHGLYVILAQIFTQWGVTFEKIDNTKLDVVRDKLVHFSKENDKLEEMNGRKIILWIETPSNPKCKVTDVKGLCSLAKSTVKEENLCIIVDSTWCTPLLLRPLELGADVVVHSTTKYIGGHSDLTGGIAVIGNSIAAQLLAPKLKIVHQVGGGVCGPFESWLALRGLRSLHVRMARHCENAMSMAEFLQGHSKVSKVYYPGLVNHPQNKLAVEQMNGRFGGMVSFLVKSTSNESTEEALNVVKNVKRFKRATSLGGTESLIEHRESVDGTSPKNLLRISLGLENIGDLIADLDAALLLY